MIRRRRVPVPLLALCLAVGLSSGCSVVRDAATWKMTPSAGPAAAGASAGTSAAPNLTQPAFDVKPLIKPAHKYIGLEMPGAPSSIAPAEQFASWVGKKPNLLGAYVGWNTGLDTQAVKNAWAYGALYFQVWEPFGVTMQQIAAGASDDYVSRFAASVRSLNLPIALSFGHEMNGDWYPWGTKQTAPADFVAAWRHVHDLFTKVGATNVIWIWDPNDIYPVPNIQLQPLYPGDQYVDWIGVTGYWTVNGPHTYSSLFLPTLLDIRKFTAKPFIIAETGVQAGSNQVASVNALFNAVATHDDILGFVWYDYNRQGDWRLENRPTVQAAFRSDVAASEFGFNVGAAR
ncbi:MAG TPA: glycosyl hydrolase [Actinocrinis sp.]|uniref:glycoside hydrolase family 26 protein n=1 Tax=Actinocrinis sp. TaxID=1920516 RepID=UPI002D58D622|nr:glycosyl hydrolase [Actinocrinis sp.]HZU58061.1 glycosyl hydrolase [Actinocrinis sp.]